MSGSTRTLVVNFVGDASKLDATVKQTTDHLSSLDKAASSLSSAAKSAVALGGAYLGLGAAKTAIDNTQTLGETVLKLHSAFGLSIKDATAWGAQVQARGGDSKQLFTSLRTLSTQVLAAATGSKTAEQAFANLGISQKDLKQHGNDLEWVLGKVSDGLAKLPPGTERGATGAKLLGRSYQTLIPLLAGGSAEMNKQLNMVSKFGITFTGGAQGIEALRQKQIDLKLAGIGLQTTFTEQVAPALMTVATDIIKVVEDLRPYKDEIEGLAAVVATAWSINKFTGIFGVENAVGKGLTFAFKTLAGTAVESAATVDASMVTAATSVEASDAAIVTANEAAAASFSALGKAAVAGVGVAGAAVATALLVKGDDPAMKHYAVHPPGLPQISAPRLGESERNYIARSLGLPSGYKGGRITAASYTGGNVDHKTVNAFFRWLTNAGSFGSGGFQPNSSSALAHAANSWLHSPLGTPLNLPGTPKGYTAAQMRRVDTGAISQASLPINKHLIEAAALAVQTAGITDRTKSQSDAAAARVTQINDMQMLASQQLQAAARNMTDSATVVQDKFAAAATAITDAAAVRHDQSQIVLQGLQDATQTQTDLLGERGLQGFQLMAQKLQVQEDIQKQGFDRMVAVQQRVVDQVKAAWDGKIAADQTRVAMVTAHTDHLTALAQQHATQVQMHGDTLLGNANAKADAVQLATDINTALAQQAVTLATGSSQAKQHAAAAALTLAQAQGARGQALAAQSLGSVTASTSLSNALATGAYQRAQDTGALAVAGANSKLAHDQGAAQRAEAQANARLTGLQDKVSIAEQRLTDQVNLLRSVGGFYYARSSAGARNNNGRSGPSIERTRGGLTINGLSIYGANKTDARIVQDLWNQLRPMLNGHS